MEIEIKLNVKPAIVGGPVMLFTKLTMQPKLAGYPLGPVTKHEIHDMYYDTVDGKLAAAGIGLRSRLLDDKPVVTLKINRRQDGALVSREEFEEPLFQDRMDWVMSHIKDLVGDGPFPVEDFMAGRPCGGLRPTLEVGTARMVRPVGKEAELAMDMIEYPGLTTQNYFDIEVESKTGEAGEKAIRAIETALHAMAGGDLVPATASKLERGLKIKAKVQAKLLGNK